VGIRSGFVSPRQPQRLRIASRRLTTLACGTQRHDWVASKWTATGFGPLPRLNHHSRLGRVAAIRQARSPRPRNRPAIQDVAAVSRQGVLRRMSPRAYTRQSDCSLRKAAVKPRGRVSLSKTRNCAGAVTVDSAERASPHDDVLSHGRTSANTISARFLAIFRIAVRSIF